MSIRKRPSPKNNSAKNTNRGSANRSKRAEGKGFEERRSKDSFEGKSNFKASKSFGKREDSARTPYKKSSGYSRNTEGGSGYKKRGEDFGSKPKRFAKNEDSPKPSRYSRPSGDKPEGGYKKRSEGFDSKPRRFSKDGDSSRTSRYSRPSGDKPEGGYKKRSEGFDSKPRKFSKDGDSSRTSRYSRPSGDKPEGGYKKRSEGSDSRPRRFSKDGDSSKTSRYSRPSGDKPESGYKKRVNTSARPGRFSKDGDDSKSSTYSPRNERQDRRSPAKKYEASKPRSYSKGGKPGFSSSGKTYGNKRFGKNKREEEMPEMPGNTRLNKYIANAGICSRREADNLIAAGLVSVNGTIITEMGYQVKPGDQVKYNGSRLSTEKKVYLMMNKPKDTITTLDDPDGRKIVTDLLKDEDLPRVYPIGRLDRNTTGVLVLTNDGELAQRLMHPKYEVQKIYKATLNKNLKGEDLWTITQGIELEDGFIKPDSIAVPDAKNEVVIEIHSGKNRIIHRIFEHVGYSLDKLDRIWYAGLNKKSLKRGEWRELNDREVKSLKTMVKLK